MQKYAFILGHRPLLSLAELAFFCKQRKIGFEPERFGNGVLIVVLSKKIIDPQDFLNQLGGTIKIAEIKSEEPATFTTFRKHLERELTANSLLNNFFAQSQGKVQFGFSLYPLQSNLSSRDLQMFLRTYGVDIKRDLRELGVSSRLVLGQKSNLSSVIINKNKILEKGADVQIIFDAHYLAIAKTLAIQDFENYKKRDYDRPQADARKGMMPPKLAQLIINLSGVKEGDIILDPFCGLGTILQEALLKGIKVIGTDIDGKTIGLAKENLAWLASEYRLNPENVLDMICTDAGYIERHLKQDSVDAIITESTLGPAMSRVPSEHIAKRNLKKVDQILTKSLKSLKLVLRKKGKIVITLPYYRLQNKRLFLPILDNIEDFGYTQVELLSSEIREKLGLELTKRNTLLYERPGQIVGREVVVLRKKEKHGTC